MDVDQRDRREEVIPFVEPKFNTINVSKKMGSNCCHVQGKRLQGTCRSLGIPFASAVTRFERRFAPSGWKPVKDGVVIFKKHKINLQGRMKELGKDFVVSPVKPVRKRLRTNNASNYADVLLRARSFRMMPPADPIYVARGKSSLAEVGPQGWECCWCKSYFDTPARTVHLDYDDYGCGGHLEKCCLWCYDAFTDWSEQYYYFRNGDIDFSIQDLKRLRMCVKREARVSPDWIKWI